MTKLGRMCKYFQVLSKNLPEENHKNKKKTLIKRSIPGLRFIQNLPEYKTLDVILLSPISGKIPNS
jgi:hypothetical protein